MATKTLITADEFEEMAARLGPCELVRGEVVPLTPGGLGHSGTSGNITGLLWQWARQSKRGRVFTNEAGIVVETDPDTVRGADVAYFSYERLPQSASPQGFSRTPPELVVEIVGKGQGWREMVEKAGEYLRMGVDRVWILDRTTRRAHIYRADSEPTVLGERDRLADADILPGFSCVVGEIFQD